MILQRKKSMTVSDETQQITLSAKKHEETNHWHKRYETQKPSGKTDITLETQTTQGHERKYIRTEMEIPATSVGALSMTPQQLPKDAKVSKDDATLDIHSNQRMRKVLSSMMCTHMIINFIMSCMKLARA